MREIVILAFPGVNLLDVAGPAQVFTSATEIELKRNPSGGPAYRISVVSLVGGVVETTSSIGLDTSPIDVASMNSIDTLLVPGGHGAEAAGADRRIASWLREMRSEVRRLGSVCTGAFILAEAGLADGRRLATHWAYCDRLETMYPRVSVDRDAIFLEDDGLWSSAGITSGLDLALAMIEQDHGHQLAAMTARQLVVFLRRPGGQSQFNTPVEVEVGEGPLAALLQWIGDNPAADHRVDELARRINLSPRTLHRQFRRSFGCTPAQWVAAERVDAVRRTLEEGDEPFHLIAHRTGFGSADSLRRAFVRRYGVPPSEYRRRFQRSVERAAPSPALKSLNRS